jgi:hypothetical protein
MSGTVALSRRVLLWLSVAGAAAVAGVGGCLRRVESGRHDRRGPGGSG